VAQGTPRVSLVDCSHAVEQGVVTYKGLPPPVICDYLTREASRQRYAPGTEFQIGRIDMVANTGTYVDAPFHRFADGIDLAELPLERLANLPAAVLHVPGRTVVDAADLASLDVAGRAVLVHTGWDRHWATDAYFEGHSYLTGEAAELLAERGAALVGIDSHNIDATDTGERPVHSVLLGAGIPIAEHLTALERLPASGARFSAVPVKVRGMGTFPVRAWAAL
jgi:arylformamidase